MEDMDPPAAYGQHINAEITSQILDSNELLDSILSITPQKVASDSSEGSGGIVKLIQDLQGMIPEFIDLFALKQKLKHDENPLNVVLA
jgi:dynein heavy chain